ncbi:MAG: hypothetical protein DWQ02_26025, partial [Bacteroidetes bacterium]
MYQIKHIFILLIFSIFCSSFSYNHIKKNRTVLYPKRNIKITIESILCKDPHDNSGGVFDPDLNTEDNIYLHINQPSYDRIPKHPVTGQPQFYKIKKNQVRGPNILWEGEILDNESFDVIIWLRNNNSLELGRFLFKLQNKHGYVLVDWEERE